MPADWENLLVAYLHDPPDKALSIRGHEDRAVELARIAIRPDIDRARLHGDTRREDIAGSIAERVPMPDPGPDYALAIDGTRNTLEVRHPLSGASRTALRTTDLDTAALRRETRRLVQGIDPPEERFLALWRSWRERLTEQDPHWSHLPAETRLPDHTIWNHLDTVAGLHGALAGAHGAAFLSFSLGPVQTFIAAARTLRDLWSGSYLLSWLTFAALGPLIDELGPAALVFPALRGNPLLDRYLRRRHPRLAEQQVILEPAADRLRLPCLPNRFVAVVPWGANGAEARGLADACETACREAWQEIAERVRERLEERLRPRAPDWDRLWQKQVASCFEVRTLVLPERECREETIGRLLSIDGRFETALPHANAVRKLGRGRASNVGLWMGQLEVLSALAEAAKLTRPVPSYEGQPDEAGRFPAKCALLGSYEQMGPAERELAGKFWQEAIALDGSRTRPNERLCAVSLVKRFAWPAYLAPELGQDPREQRFEDTATIAARAWLRAEPVLEPDEVWNRKARSERHWSGQWLHWQRRDDDQDEEAVPVDVWQLIQKKKVAQGRPPAYYAVLMMDGDSMGSWLRGERTPPLREVLHSKIRAHYEQQAWARQALETKRPVSPALHASISEALTNFALHFVPDIVAAHQGELIYAGGDDVLALLPTAQALGCARALRETYRQNWCRDRQGREWLLMGDKATLSAGLVVAHYKEDLRFVLERARTAEKEAKRLGRDVLALTLCRRAGEQASALVPWELVDQVQNLVRCFQGQDRRPGCSDRWAYKLRRELRTLQGPQIPWPAIRAETSRLLDRLEEPDRQTLHEPVLKLLDAYHRHMIDVRKQTAAQALEGFVTLCQGAAFLARGRDE